MPATVQELQRIIEEEFPGSDASGITERGHRVSGIIRWQGFKNKDPHERNRLITEKVRDRLGLRGVNIGILFPVAPGE